MNTTAEVSATWPADIVHVNEDGWVLINRGSQHGVQVGLRLLVVGQGIRELRNLFAPVAPGSDAADTASLPTLLRIRRTYEQLEVIYAEAESAIAIATRTPAARRPSVYTGPAGELLVWVPLPEGWTWPHPGTAPDDADDADDDIDDISEGDESATATSWQTDTQASSDADTSGDSQGSITDAPPERGEQDDERWEEALPLNGVSVGDIVMPAMPAIPATSSTAASTVSTATSFEQGRDYDWMRPNQ